MCLSIRRIGDLSEPGSVFELVTFATALEQGVIHAGEQSFG